MQRTKIVLSIAVCVCVLVAAIGIGLPGRIGRAGAEAPARRDAPLSDAFPGTRAGTRASAAAAPAGALDARPTDPEPPDGSGGSGSATLTGPALGSAPEAVSLDEAPADVVAEQLDAAIARARADRGLPIDDGLVERVITDGTVRILVAQPRARLGLEPRLAGTRHAPARYFHHVPYAAIEVGPQALLDLVESLDVLGIELDRAHHPSLDESVPLISADAATAAGFDGSDLVIALLDTGVDTTHPVFAGRVIDEACFSQGGDCPGGGTRELGPGSGAPCTFSGSCGHGTLVAGVALGLDPLGVLTGVAPDAGLISIQVFSNDNGKLSAYASDIIAALEHVYDLRAFHTIAAVNMSFGGESKDGGVHDSTASCDAANGARKAIIDLLRGAGIASVASSGNEALTGQLSEPACISSVISVGSTTKSDAISPFSNSASFLSLLAPGSLIRTSRSGGGFATSSGTSMAAPHVSGAWAAIREAVPGSNVAEVLFALQSTGLPITDGRNGVTTSRIDVAAAITALDAGIDIPDPVAGPGGGVPGVVPPPALPSSACGLVGLEALAAYGIALAARRWRRQRAPRRV